MPLRITKRRAMPKTYTCIPFFPWILSFGRLAKTPKSTGDTSSVVVRPPPNRLALPKFHPSTFRLLPLPPPPYLSCRLIA